jgi:hypothetical protein
MGIDVEEKDRQWRQWYLQKQQVLKKNRHKDSEGHKGNAIVDSVRKTVAPDKMKEVQKELFVAQERLAAEHEPPKKKRKGVRFADDASLLFIYCVYIVYSVDLKLSSLIDHPGLNQYSQAGALYKSGLR